MSHARLGPSNHRWITCPGSIREESAYPDVPGNAAIDGTGSHLLLEMCLKNKMPASHYKDKVIGEGHKDREKGWLVKQDRIDRVSQCISYVDRRKKELEFQYPGEVEIELESKSSPGVAYGRDDWWGTVDITLAVMHKRECLFVEVIDYKDGRGFVGVHKNPQLTAYLGGKVWWWTLFKGDNVRMTIVQPKTSPVVRYEDITPVNLKKDLDRLAEAAKKTDALDAPLVPGNCKWCKHWNNCPERKKEAIGELDMDEVFKLLTTNTSEMKDEQLSKLLNAETSILDMFKQVRVEAELRLKNGKDVAGYAMLPGNSSKKWNIPEDQLYKFLQTRKLKKDEIYIPKLISPAQALKHEVLTDKQKKNLEEYIDIIPGDIKLKAFKKVEKSVDMFDNLVIQCNTETPVSFL